VVEGRERKTKLKPLAGQKPAHLPSINILYNSDKNSKLSTS